MLNLGFTNKYKVVHLTPELGKSAVGGICTFINELYSNTEDDSIGFVQVLGNTSENIAPELYEGINKNALIIGIDETQNLELLQCDTIVIHFFPFAEFITDTIARNTNIVFVVHSIPTTEPWNLDNPFNDDNVKSPFEYLCHVATKLVCVSEAEKSKLSMLYPAYADKVTVIYNGIDESVVYNNTNYKNSRSNLGYIGRYDVRKGVLPLIKSIAKFDVKLNIASGRPNHLEFARSLEYLNASEGLDKFNFLGWCIGERKDEFFKSIDALIIPSLYEPFGYIALEAMKYELPIISSCNGGLLEILGEDYRYLYNPYKEGDFENVLSTFMSDDVETVEKQVNILRKRLTNFTTDKMVKNYNNLLLHELS